MLGTPVVAGITALALGGVGVVGLRAMGAEAGSGSVPVAVAPGARLVTLDIDGNRRQVWTSADDVGALLSSLGLRLQGAALSASRSTRLAVVGPVLTVRTPKLVTVVADGTTRSRLTTVASNAELLSELGLVIGPADSLSEQAEDAPYDGEVLTLTRVALRRFDVRTAITVAVEERRTSTLAYGVRRTAQAGSPGVLVVTMEQRYEDGMLADTTEVARRVVRAMRPTVVLVGTRVQRAAGLPTSPLDWAALAHCESGGNPRAVSPSGLYFGLYQFDLRTWHGTGATGNPVDASPAEQTYRAQILYSHRGSSPWPVCGKYL